MSRVVEKFQRIIDQFDGGTISSDEHTPHVYGVFGNPVSHSLSPLMHNQAFSYSGFRGVYLPFDVDDIETAISAARELNIKGISVTIPHKIRVMAFLDALDDQAESIGAVNTVVNRNGLLKGYNTDGEGALRALSEKETIAGKQIAIIGAGGAARAVGYAVQQAGGKITVVNRTIQTGENLAALLDASFLPLSEADTVSCDILINATPLGMTPETDRTPVPGNIFKKGMTVMDTIYTPLQTLFLKEAKAAGCNIIDGLSMFVYQGAIQFERWTGFKAPVDVMRSVVLNSLTPKGTTTP